MSFSPGVALLRVQGCVVQGVGFVSTLLEQHCQGPQHRPRTDGAVLVEDTSIFVIIALQIEEQLETINKKRNIKAGGARTIASTGSSGAILMLLVGLS